MLYKGEKLWEVEHPVKEDWVRQRYEGFEEFKTCPTSLGGKQPLRLVRARGEVGGLEG